MPHIIVEYASGRVNEEQLGELLDSLYQALVEFEMFDERNIKLRGVPVSHYRLGCEASPGDGSFNGETPKGFMHIECRIHRGRLSLQKRSLTELMIATAVESLTASSIELSVITCELLEMDRDSYGKWQPASMHD